MTTIARWWPVALLLGVFGATALAFARCAVAEMVARFAVRLYTPDAEDRLRKREEWLRILEDMVPSERPGHAGSLLWAGLRRVPGRIRSELWFRLGWSAGQQDVILILRAYCGKRSVGRLRGDILRMKVFVRPSLGKQMVVSLVEELPAWATATSWSQQGDNPTKGSSSRSPSKGPT